MSSGIAWALAGAIVVLAGTIAGLVALLASVSRRPYTTADVLDQARKDALEKAGELATERLGWQKAREGFEDRIDILTDERTMLINDFEAERRGWRAKEIAHDVIRAQRDHLLAALAKVAKADPAVVSGLIRAELGRLSPGASGGSGGPGAGGG